MKTSDRVNGPDRLEKNGAIGKIRTIMWKPKLKFTSIFAPDIKINQL